MPASQLKLFPSAKPLSQRFGSAFFRELPKSPGVYLMFDGQGRLLYVGQSGNLRQRLGSYRHVHPDRNSRKLIRLVHTVARIEWEECCTHDAAKLRENLLLRERQPRFNSINKWPRAHCFIGLHCFTGGVEFSFTRELPQDAEGFYGAFKSGVLAGYTSLLRVLWTVIHQTTALHEYPRALLQAKPPARLVVTAGVDPQGIEPWRELLALFFNGSSFALARKLQAHLPDVSRLSLFHRNLLADDFAQIENFFLRGPLRNAELRREHGVAERLIEQEALDDLLVIKRAHA